MLSLPNETMKK